VSLEKGLFVFPAWHMQDGLGQKSIVLAVANVGDETRDTHAVDG
jgi:hypothetical protein